ncbi:GTP cyclohydrolase I [Microbacterium sp. A196]|uniref:GTP cyclohydrolase I n=1 Tax=Microbacterium sp. A196 TaxID=3457320 RepID=UPI003FD67902
MAITPSCSDGYRRGGRTVDLGAAADAVRALLVALGEDPERPGLAKTPARVSEQFALAFSGIDADLGAVLTDGGLVETEPVRGVVALTKIPFRSTCEHHLTPFRGHADVFYAPGDAVAGFSRIADLVGLAARRPQLQEQLGERIAEAMDDALGPRGVVVRLSATHECIAVRNPASANAEAVTIASRGELSVSEVLGELEGAPKVQYRYNEASSRISETDSS